jgi:hypothetical protein
MSFIQKTFQIDPPLNGTRQRARHSSLYENDPEELSSMSPVYSMVRTAAVQGQDHSAPSQQAVRCGLTVLRH